MNIKNVPIKEASIYLNREDSHQVEEEERNVFIRGVLDEIGLPIEDIWPEPTLTLEQKIELRKLLVKFDVLLLDDRDRGMEIYVGNEVIAKWHKPKFILRVDEKQKDPTKKLYFEMIVKYQSLFDNEETETTE